MGDDEKNLDRVEIGLLLQQARKRAGFKRAADFADHLGWKLSRLQRLESGRARLEDDQRDRLDQELGARWRATGRDQPDTFLVSDAPAPEYSRSVVSHDALAYMQKRIAEKAADCQSSEELDALVNSFSDWIRTAPPSRGST